MKQLICKKNKLKIYEDGIIQCRNEDCPKSTDEYLRFSSIKDCPKSTDKYFDENCLTWADIQIKDEKMRKISLYVHRCHKCGKPVTSEPTSLEVIDEIVILCSDCGKVKK